MKYSTLFYSLLTILGLVFLAHYLLSIFQGSIETTFAMVPILFFLSTIGPSFLIIGLSGIVGPYFKKSKRLTSLQSKLLGKSMIKLTRMFGFIVVLAIVFLILILVGTYLDAGDTLNILTLFSATSPTKLGQWLMLGGIILITVGMVGIIRQYFKNHKNLLSALAILSIPPLTFTIFFVAYNFTILSAPMFPIRSEITQVTVVDTNPLILSVDVKAITSRDTRIDSAFILDSSDTIVASYCNEEIMVKEVSTFEPICILPAGSEINVTVDFNTTLPSGDYLVRLSSWGDNHGDSLFTIP